MQLNRFLSFLPGYQTPSHPIEKAFTDAQLTYIGLVKPATQPLNSPRFDPKRIFSTVYELNAEGFPTTSFQVSTTGYHAKSTLKTIENTISSACRVYKPWFPSQLCSIEILAELSNHDVNALTISVITVQKPEDLAVFDEVDASGHRIHPDSLNSKPTMHECLYEALHAGLNRH